MENFALHVILNYLYHYYYKIRVNVQKHNMKLIFY